MGINTAKFPPRKSKLIDNRLDIFMLKTFWAVAAGVYKTTSS